MIKDGSISYSNGTDSHSSLLLWEPENSVVNALFIGLVTTLLSVQATAIVFDFLLGLKPAGRVTVSDLHSLLLVWSSSPLAVLNNVMRKDWITRRYYKGDIPADTKIGRNQMRIKRRVLLKLFLLFSAGPVMNVIAVAVVLEREKYVSIAESGFGGLGWGVNMDLKVAESHQITETCKQYNISTIFQDDVVVRFSSCNLPVVLETTNLLPGYGLISVGVEKQSEIFVSVKLQGWFLTAPAVPQLFANETLFQVKHGLTNSTAAVLVDKGMELMSAECGLGDVNSTAEEFVLPDPQTTVEHIHTKKLPCQRRVPVSEEVLREQLYRIAKRLREYITFVDTQRLQLFVAEDPSGEASSINPTAIDHIVFLRRRQRAWSAAIVSMVAASLLAIRLATVSFLNNDVALAAELAVKRRLGMGIYESMLQNGKGDVTYNNKYQEGTRAQYGLIRFDLPMIQRFQGGILGGSVEN